jgi:hypothetical protein
MRRAVSIEPRLLPLALALLLGACSTVPSTVGLTPWDQTRVTTLSQQLLAGANRWHLTLIQQGRGSGRLQQSSVAIQQQAASLAAHLEAGQGFAETVRSYQFLRELMDDADDGVDRTSLEQPAEDAWQSLRGAVAEITPYYDTRSFGS